MDVIYIVEDDENISELVRYALEGQGYEVKSFLEGGDIDFKKADLILLDIMLPKEDGISILKRIRRNPETKDKPVIMLTAKDGELDKVRAFELGADDYVDKPFSILELQSRIKALLRRTKSDKKILEYGNIKMDLERYKVYLKEEEIKLTNKEFQLLKYLMENQSIVLTREQILEKVWGYDFSGDTRTIDVHIGSLRSKLKDEKEIIKTVINVGYKLGD